MYGGTDSIKGPIYPTQGLSPRVRGNQQQQQQEVVKYGSIPACTGEPLYDRGKRLAGQVYPRVYGGTFAFLNR